MLEICQFFFDHGFFRWLAGLIYLVLIVSTARGLVWITINRLKPKEDSE